MRVFAALLLTASALAHAQEYPSKPIRLIVATAPGGLMDVPARLLADYFEKTFGQRVLFDKLNLNIYRGERIGRSLAEVWAKTSPVA